MLHLVQGYRLWTALRDQPLGRHQRQALASPAVYRHKRKAADPVTAKKNIRSSRLAHLVKPFY